VSLVDTCKKKLKKILKENFLSLSQYYHIRGNFLGVVYLFLFQKKMTNLVFSTVIFSVIDFLEESSFSQTGVGRLNEPHLSLLSR